MEVTKKLTGDELIVELKGEVDESGLSALRPRIDESFFTTGARRVVVDLSGVSFMDSTGIGMLLGRYKALKLKGVPIFLRSPTPVVDKLLNLSGIYEIMPRINR